MKLSEIRITENKNRIISELKKTNRTNIETLTFFLESSDFFVAPASTKYHLNCKGGLAQHCINVKNVFVVLCKSIGVEIPSDSLIIVPYLHDFCKINIYRYNFLKSGEISKATPYIKKDNFVIGHGEKSVIMIQNLITLTRLEQMLIRWHMGMFDSSFLENINNMTKDYPEVVLFHFADWIASLFLDSNEQYLNSENPNRGELLNTVLVNSLDVNTIYLKR